MASSLVIIKEHTILTGAEDAEQMRGHADVLDAHGVDAKDPLVSV